MVKQVGPRSLEDELHHQLTSRRRESQSSSSSLISLPNQLTFGDIDLHDVLETLLPSAAAGAALSAAPAAIAQPGPSFARQRSRLSRTTPQGLPPVPWEQQPLHGPFHGVQLPPELGSLQPALQILIKQYTEGSYGQVANSIEVILKAVAAQRGAQRTSPLEVLLHNMHGRALFAQHRVDLAQQAHTRAHFASGAGSRYALKRLALCDLLLRDNQGAFDKLDCCQQLLLKPRQPLDGSLADTPANEGAAINALKDVAKARLEGKSLDEEQSIARWKAADSRDF